MSAMASQITSLTIVYTQPFIQGTDQSKYQRSASLAFVRGIHRRPVNSPHKWPVTRKMFPFDDVIIIMGCPTVATLCWSSAALFMKPSCHDANFVVTSSLAACHNDSLRCHLTNYGKVGIITTISFQGQKKKKKKTVVKKKSFKNVRYFIYSPTLIYSSNENLGYLFWEVWVNRLFLSLMFPLPLLVAAGFYMTFVIGITISWQKCFIW